MGHLQMLLDNLPTYSNNNTFRHINNTVYHRVNSWTTRPEGIAVVVKNYLREARTGLAAAL